MDFNNYDDGLKCSHNCNILESLKYFYCNIIVIF